MSDSVEDHIDLPTFEQLLEMDDDENDRQFSSDLVQGFKDQAEETFASIEEALQQKDLGRLSELGHFLKGSSAAVGLTKVVASCEKIQHYGQKKDETGNGFIDDDQECLQKIQEEFETVKGHYATCCTYLDNFFKTGQF